MSERSSTRTAGWRVTPPVGRIPPASRSTIVRKARVSDGDALYALYHAVALQPGGLVRRPDEVSRSFVRSLVDECRARGLLVVVEQPASGQLVGAVHAMSAQLADMSHVMQRLTVLVRPDLQGRGLGRRLLHAFLAEIATRYPQTCRVELQVRTSSERALQLCGELGFTREGLFRSRISNRGGELEDGVALAWFNPNWQPGAVPRRPSARRM